MLRNLKFFLVTALLCVFIGANAQLKYTSEGKITLGDISPHEFYTRSGITMFNNQSVTSNTSVSGWFIQSKNVSVSNKVKLDFNVGESLTIDVPFTLASGSQLEIKAN